MFEAQLRSPWGERHAVVIYLADVIIGAERFPGVEIAADESETEYILGRNILSKLALFLDGPQQLTHILAEPLLQRLRASQSAD